MKNKNIKVMRIAMKDDRFDKVKVSFHGGLFSIDHFTCMIMALIEDYTAGMLKLNEREAVFNHWNNAFGKLLNKIVPEKEHYQLSQDHKDFKKTVDKTLGRKETLVDKVENEQVRKAAIFLTRDILTTEVGLTEQAADVILNKRLNNVKKISSEEMKDLHKKINFHVPADIKKESKNYDKKHK